VSTPSLEEILPKEMKELRTWPLFMFLPHVEKATVIGKTPSIDRRVGVITGGRFEGERLRGRLLPGGSDWQTVRSDAAWTLDVRVVMETDDGHFVGMTYHGLRHGPQDVLDRIARGEQVSPASYYLRAAPFFETSSENMAG
jgi:uncharacterized protein DUF3237